MKNFEVYREDNLATQGVVFDDGLVVARQYKGKRKGAMIWPTFDGYKEQCLQDKNLTLKWIKDDSDTSN